MFNKNEFKPSYIIAGLILLTFGICFLFLNDSVITLGITVGVILALLGFIYSIIEAVSIERGPIFIIKMIFSVICVGAGVMTAVFNDDVIDIVISVFCLLAIVDGSFKLYTAAVSKRYSLTGWWLMAAFSATIILSAFLLLTYTPAKVSLSVLFLGIIIVADAANNFVSSVFAAKQRIAQRAAVYYEVHRDIENRNNS